MITYEEKIPTSEEYNYISDAVGWGIKEDKIVETALNNSLYSICAYDADKIIGF